MPPEEIKPDDYAGTPGSGSVPGSSSPMDDLAKLVAEENARDAAEATKGVPATGEAIAEKITANSFDELFDELNRRGSLIDGSGVKNSATLLIYTINAFRAGKAQIDEITQTAGLRELVRRLRVTEELDAYFVATGASAPTGAPKAPESPEDKKKALEALILATKTRSLDLLFSDQLPAQKSFSQREFVEELVKDIKDVSVKTEAVKEIGLFIQSLVKNHVLQRHNTSKLVVGKALGGFNFEDAARVADAKESLLKGEGIKKPAAAAPAAPGTPASPTGAPAAPDAVVPANDVVEKDYVKDFLPDQTTLDKEAPLERAEPFDPKKALKNPGFVEWFKENEATIGLTEADFAGTDAKKLERAALFYDAYEARSEVLVGVKKFIATELENLGVKSGDGVIAADDFNGKIEEYLAKNLLEKPERILRIKEILDDNAGLVEDAKKLQEEAKKKLEKLNERALGGREISALDQEEQLLKELKKIETGELADVGSAVAGRVEKLFQRAASFLHLGGGGTAKYSGSRDSVGALMRSSRENDAVLAYEKFNKDRGVFTPITKEGVDSRLSEVQKLKSQATSLPEDIKAAKEELKTAKASLSLARDSAIGALGIAKLALESSEGAVSKHIGGLFKAVDDSADKKKYEQIRVADKNISKLKGSLGDGFDGAIDSAETELKAKIAKLAEEEIVRNTDSLRSLDDESLISSMAEQLKPLFLASSGFNVITRDEYKEIMIFALDKAANHFSKKKESAKAAALRQFSLSVKNAEPGDDAFVKILEKKPVKSRKKI